MSLTLAAGLWPFTFRLRNGVSWAVDRKGLRFSQFGSATGISPFEGTDICANSNSPFTLELWVEPEKTSGYGTILAIGSEENVESFSVRQSLGDIELVDGLRNRNRTSSLRTQ
jgi:hypothetical protein